MTPKYEADFINAISLGGFKSFATEQRLEIRPLTLLAGANSSGKSSAMQPLLLLKQTLEIPYDPGPLLLAGPNVRFTSAEQLLTRVGGRAAKEFKIKVELTSKVGITDVFRVTRGSGFELEAMTLSREGREMILRQGMSKDELLNLSDLLGAWVHGSSTVTRDRCFLEVKGALKVHGSDVPLNVRPASELIPLLLSLIHVPGLRGNPTRTYGRTAVDANIFPGTFENYVASVIHDWHEQDDERLDVLAAHLSDLGLTSTVRAVPVDATRVELLVGRLPAKRSSHDLVNIADVGFGVSQVLPVLVALLTARRGQFVYIEQPELHLHPRAQEALAAVLAAAANRGVRVVAETHSSLLLLAVQTLVVEGKLSPDNVKLHWFQRDARGATQVQSADLDALGAYGDWPEDFARVRGSAENRYLNAVESQVFPPRKNARKR